MFENFRKLILILIFFFLAYLVFLVISSSNKGNFSSPGALDERASDNEALVSTEDSLEEKSKIELQGFSRQEVKDGKKVWSIKANNAKIYDDENLTHVDDVKVEVARENGGTVFIESERARISFTKEEMQKADLEGSVLIRVDASLSLEAEFATYNAIKREINVPGDVKIFGTGYVIKGEGLDMNVDEEGFILRKSVQTKFVKGAKIPSPLDAKE